ncbi:hypothetical protein C0J52_19396 [Blattella germanica]|nr:hypothetical protein C0J52_19396 [Blattella germanica]
MIFKSKQTVLSFAVCFAKCNKKIVSVGREGSGANQLSEPIWIKALDKIGNHNSFSLLHGNNNLPPSSSEADNIKKEQKKYGTEEIFTEEEFSNLRLLRLQSTPHSIILTSIHRIRNGRNFATISSGKEFHADTIHSHICGSGFFKRPFSIKQQVPK